MNPFTFSNDFFANTISSKYHACTGSATQRGANHQQKIFDDGIEMTGQISGKLRHCLNGIALEGKKFSDISVEFVSQFDKMLHFKEYTYPNNHQEAAGFFTKKDTLILNSTSYIKIQEIDQNAFGHTGYFTEPTIWDKKSISSQIAFVPSEIAAIRIHPTNQIQLFQGTMLSAIAELRQLFEEN